MNRTPPTAGGGPAGRYFAGRRLKQENRIGSVNGKYWPYGERYGGGPWNDEAFATYYRDSGTGLDYADQRYYGSTMGRFLTADPYHGFGGPADPQSWNRYSYVRNDPINRIDPDGLQDVVADVGTILRITVTGQSCPPGMRMDAGGSCRDENLLADAWGDLLRIMGRGGPDPFRLELMPDGAFSIPMHIPATT
ncbi:MAG: RHS repeat-associated core domain-containing protein [Bryobacterales bacterium]|nr:RHS repeat-associated core domain-containing protein [Bryobacterales bacterium]